MTRTPVICFDMDGTLNSFYGVPNWLDCLIANDPAPYRVAKPALRMDKLARQLNVLQRKGAKLVVISWLSKNSNESFDNAVTEEKLRWLKKHLSSVAWDEIFIVPYGTNKATCCGVDNDCFVLFDDEEQNRKAWNKLGGAAYHPAEITTTLSMLNRKMK